MLGFLFIILCTSSAFAEDSARPVANLTCAFSDVTSSAILSLTQVGQLAYFIAVDQGSPAKLWQTDGTQAGTYIIPATPAGCW